MNKLHTKFGTAKINNSGHYRITSRKEGNNGKLLHRLIWEDFYGCEVPKGYVIHHRNHIKTDNCILNLQLIRDSDHKKIHNTGKVFSEETRKKLSENHADASGENNPRWKNYPRIVKAGFHNNKQRYAIRYEGKYIKYSMYIHKLYKWWGETHSDKFLYLEI
jgi:hypothetical protein